MLSVNNEIKHFSLLKDELKKQISELLSDSDIPITERWEVFCNAAEAGLITNIKDFQWTSRLIENKLDLCYFDDFGLDKYQTVYFVDLIEVLEDMHVDEEVVNLIKTEMVESGYTGFILDW